MFRRLQEDFSGDQTEQLFRIIIAHRSTSQRPGTNVQSKKSDHHRKPNDDGDHDSGRHRVRPKTKPPTLEPTGRAVTEFLPKPPQCGNMETGNSSYHLSEVGVFHG